METMASVDKAMRMVGTVPIALAMRGCEPRAR